MTRNEISVIRTVVKPAIKKALQRVVFNPVALCFILSYAISLTFPVHIRLFNFTLANVKQFFYSSRDHVSDR